MKKIFIFLLFTVILSAAAFSQDREGFGIHGGIGTDINLGLAGGIKGSFFPLGLKPNPLEVAVELFYSKSVEVSSEGIHEYVETTELIVFGVISNILYGYQLNERGVFYIIGAGAGAISVEWLETSETDSSLGTPYGTSGSQQSVEGTTGGAITNVGVGYHLGNGLEIRLELPIIIIYSEYGGTSNYIPTLTLTAGFRI